ncbi:MAG: hypothetical protein PQJ58_18385 [Spirochaetales bacterium]|nr:hypothetical protein [Spirochaetales bacterium]
MENRDTQLFCSTYEDRNSDNQSRQAEEILWEADFFQITPEGQEILQKVAEPVSL